MGAARDGAPSYLRLGAGELAGLQPMAQLYEALVMQAMRSLVPAAPIRLDEQDRHDWAFSPTSCNSRAVGSALSTSGDVPDRQPHGGRPSRPRIPSTSGSGALGGAAWRRTAAAASAHHDPRLGDGPTRRPTGAGPGPPAGGCSPRRVGFLTAVFGRCPAARSCPMARWPWSLPGAMALAVPTAGRCLGDNCQSSALTVPVESR